MNKLLFFSCFLLPSLISATNVVDVLKADGRFSTLVTAVEKANLVDALQGEGPFTILAPTNAAFEKIDPVNLNLVLENSTELESVLKRHVIPAKVEAIDVDSGPVTTLGGEIIFAEATPTENAISVTFSYGSDNPEDEIKDKTTATVIEADIKGADGEPTNGVVHAIDTVLI